MVILNVNTFITRSYAPNVFMLISPNSVIPCNWKHKWVKGPISRLPTLTHSAGDSRITPLSHARFRRAIFLPQSHLSPALLTHLNYINYHKFQTFLISDRGSFVRNQSVRHFQPLDFPIVNYCLKHYLSEIKVLKIFMSEY